jgi:prepilin-type N-terminal cleavage/methylation domain-containing protein
VSTISPFTVIPDGFTLVELLVATAVFGALVFLLARVFSEATRAWSTAKTTTDSSQSARTALDMMNRDLQGMFVNTNAGYVSTYGTSTMNFYASASYFTGARDICRVKYYVAGKELLREFEYWSYDAGTTSAGNALQSVTTSIISNVWSVTGQPGFNLSYYLADGRSLTIFPAGPTITVPARIIIQLKIWDPTSMKAGQTTLSTSFQNTASVGAYLPYETTVFLLPRQN